MIQEIIVFILFFSIIGFGLYRFFFGSKSKPSGGCSNCASNPQVPSKKADREKKHAEK